MSPEIRQPRLSVVVVHWHGEDELQEWVEAFAGADERFELVVVDNGSSRPLPEGAYRRVAPGRNLGFAGGANTGVQAARGEIVLLANPDAYPRPGALSSLLGAFDAHPEVSGFAPRLVWRNGESQYEWQLKPLPRPTELLLHALWHAPRRSPESEPAAGTPVEQPAAAALALRRDVLMGLGGLDEGFFPAWFEDVDLARRLADAGHRILYWPDAELVHSQGSTVPTLGYGPFLWIYYRNLCRYLGKHHGAGWVAAARLLLLPGMLLRMAALALRRPRRAASRVEAVKGQLMVMAGAVDGFRSPGSLRHRFPPAEERE